MAIFFSIVNAGSIIATFRAPGEPRSALMQARDGNIYGIVFLGGPGGGGVAFRFATNGRAVVWLGLKNSDDIGLRLDLLVEVFVEGDKRGEQAGVPEPRVHFLRELEHRPLA
jgi:hypothetical protein